MAKVRTRFGRRRAVALSVVTILSVVALILGTSAQIPVPGGLDASAPPAATEGASASGAGGLVVRAPSRAQVGRPFEVLVSAEGIVDAEAIGANLRFDATATTLGDVVSADDGLETLVIARPDGAGVAGYRNVGSVNPAGSHHTSFTAPFTPSAPGRFVLSIDSVRVTGADGEVLLDEPVRTIVVQVGDATETHEPSGDTPRSREAGATKPSLDLTGDGTIDDADVSEVALGWTQVQSVGDACALGADERLNALDLDGSGCLDVADLQRVANGAGSTDGSDTAPVDIRPTLGATPMAAAVARPPFVVTATSDETDNAIGDGICNTSIGACTLRAAIVQANRNAGPDRIEFDIPGSGVKTIQLTTNLPTITDTTGGLTIDGFTQPGSVPNTDPLVSNAQIRIEVRGTGQTNNSAAFTATSPDNVWRGLAIYNAFYGIKLFNGNADRNTIVGSHIGTNAAGTYGDAVGFTLGAGVWLYNGASANVIGTPAPADRNVISGNKTVGVKIEQFGTDANVVRNNIVGLNPSATGRLPNNSGFDLQWRAGGNIIGGTGLNEHNLISGNAYAGIDLSHTTRNNQVVGNYVGTTASGNSAASWTANADGILIKDNPHGNVIADNVLAGNAKQAIWTKHNYTTRNTIRNNRIGVGLDGSAVPNGAHGIFLTGQDHIVEGNIIANNRGAGIMLSNAVGDNNNYPSEPFTLKNRITANSFFDNTGLAIDIPATGFNPNDDGDGDGGIQSQLNHPEVAAATVGQITGTACAACRVEVYAADGSGEGRQHLGFTTADGSGAFTYTDASVTTGTVLTLLTIDGVGNTSEFSPTVAVGATVAVAPAALSGAFVVRNVGGRQVALVPDGTRSTPSSASATSHKVRFEVNAPVAAVYKIEAEVIAPSGSADSFFFQVDGWPSTGHRWDLSSGSGVHQDDVSIAGGADPFTVGLAGGNHTILISLREDGAGIATVRLVPVSLRQTTGIDVTPPGNQTTNQGDAVDLQVVASDPDGGVVTHSTLGLPPGLSINSTTGRVTGTPTAGGQYPVSLFVSDGPETVVLTFTWTVIHANRAPVVVSPGDQIDPRGAGITPVAVGVDDPDGNAVTWSATGLPIGLAMDPITGVISGTPTIVSATNAVTVSATDPGGLVGSVSFNWQISVGAFACTVSQTAVDWTDQAVTAYYVRHIVNGVETYLGAVNGTRTYAITKPYGTYRISYVKAQVTYYANCDGPDPVPAPTPFTCTVDKAAGLVRWTAQTQPQYFVRHIVNGVETYLGGVSGTQYAITTFYGTYRVTYAVGGTIHAATCDGPDPVPVPEVFRCTVDPTTVTLSWTDKGATAYYVRRFNNGVETYVGGVNGLSTAITDATKTYSVTYLVGGTKIVTTCFAASIDAATATLTWIPQGVVTTYRLSRIEADGTTQTDLGDVTGTSVVLAQPTRRHILSYVVGTTTFSVIVVPPPAAPPAP